MSFILNKPPKSGAEVIFNSQLTYNLIGISTTDWVATIVAAASNVDSYVITKLAATVIVSCTEGCSS